MNNRLPTYLWQQQTYLKGQFNNVLQNGFNQGLSLYDPEKDLKLFQNIDYNPINPNKINFDKLQDELDDKGKVYNQGKQLINGFVDGVNDAVGGTEQNIKQAFDKVSNYFSNLGNDFKLILGGMILFLLLNRK